MRNGPAATAGRNTLDARSASVGGSTLTLAGQQRTSRSESHQCRGKFQLKRAWNNKSSKSNCINQEAKQATVSSERAERERERARWERSAVQTSCACCTTPVAPLSSLRLSRWLSARSLCLRLSFPFFVVTVAIAVAVVVVVVDVVV